MSLLLLSTFNIFWLPNLIIMIIIFPIIRFLIQVQISDWHFMEFPLINQFMLISDFLFIVFHE